MLLLNVRRLFYSVATVLSIYVATLSAVPVTQMERDLVDTSSSSFGGADGKGTGEGLAGSLQVCVADSLVWAGDAGAAAAGVGGSTAIGQAEASNNGSNGQNKGSKAQVVTQGQGVAAAEAVDLCVADNCLGGGGTIGAGHFSAGAVDGAIQRRGPARFASRL